MKRLQALDQVALGFMVFALFLGAGNIIFPPSAGLAAGEQLWWAALGFLLTAVGLPLLTIVAVARAGGGMSLLTAPLGRTAGLLMAVSVYLAIGPLFATPRTAVVSFEMAIVPLTGDGAWSRALYGLLYFALVLFLALQRGQLIERIGKFITPILLIGLLLLGVGAFWAPVAEISAASAEAYRIHPLLKGAVEGYLTMDTLGALVFGVVVSTALREQGISEPSLIMRYSIRAGLIAALGLSVVYLSFFYLGASSAPLVEAGSNGALILTRYVQHVFGGVGQLVLAVVILLACLTTAVGLVVACATFFSPVLSLSYPLLATLFSLFSLLVAHQGLDALIRVSVPVLVGLYPLAIVLVVLNLLSPFWSHPARIFRPVMAVTLLFGLMDGLVAAGYPHWIPQLLRELPLSGQSLGWLLPVLLSLLVAVMVDRCAARLPTDSCCPED